ncbi:MAG TPA: hypothetical protein DEP82_07200, partial [Arthrobacter bacterium]|nr:hypothetical protein [Arthrobacter sp.]
DINLGLGGTVPGTTGSGTTADVNLGLNTAGLLDDVNGDLGGSVIIGGGTDGSGTPGTETPGTETPGTDTTDPGTGTTGTTGDTDTADPGTGTTGTTGSDPTGINVVPAGAITG